MRHAAIAITLAVVFGLTTFLRPLDITVWSLQAKLFERQPSGDIVYVEMKYGEARGEGAEQNRALTKAIQTIANGGAELIVLNMPLRRSRSNEADAALRAELIENRDRIVLTRTVISYSDQFGKVPPSDPYFEQGLKIASNDYESDFLGYVWFVYKPNSVDKAELPPLWAILSNNRRTIASVTSIDYTIDPAGLPQYGFEELEEHEQNIFKSLNGKAVILGPEALIKMPSSGEMPVAFLHALAAETDKRGRGLALPWYVLSAVYALALLLGATSIRSDRSRRFYYAALVGSMPIAVASFAYFGVRVSFSEVIALIAFYALQRATVRYKRRHLLVEPRSKLPNFTAFRRDLEGNSLNDSKAIVVAKIARLDSVFTTLSQSEQTRYLRLIAGRLALGESAASIYYDGGKYFAFFLERAYYEDLEGHLSGLRAIASQAITLGDRVLDVSMTIGVDATSGKTTSSRLSAATAAADQAREAYRPVFVISDQHSEAEEWDHSLQARLEQALSEDRIAIALQPQADFRSGQIVAAESLARWNDREKGEISPARFIGQCERVGRLDELTKRVLSKTLDAAEALDRQGFQPGISVNVSAIQFVDDRIADLIEFELSQRAFDPTQLTIELTETTRIEDFGIARATIERIRRLGPKFAIDDFGVASANLEVIFELPFDEIKIDRLFVNRLDDSAMARAILANLVNLARDAGIVSTAEGVENQATFNLLRELGCDRGQGFFIARPLPVSQFIETLVLQKDSQKVASRLG